MLLRQDNPHEDIQTRTAVALPMQSKYYFLIVFKLKNKQHGQM